ncbi:formylmethanofuran--tetrahydromethanopterin formyltransferase [candidate division MSBL1 archaeon SCGC-AAA259B11]|uniref:Formylmethanofuran--tetrahydromethanopterin formyltransferase n=1 Tax=candidate division MSBL1 archaeon SCGC-AAA259B11 TaxID=1698260 RepID=A0A133U5A4_9EURY|nr:formylmethanofuran--tetrahydromethanopterin formyltransferase [candidate division MSBL1 archaeon SCGC-AAA259B11]
MSFELEGVEIEDTYAEAFSTFTSRVLITAKNEKWAIETAREATGFGTSQVMCPAEAGIDFEPESTPDDRPGVVIQICGPKKDSLEQQLLARVGQCVLTSPTAAAFNALDSEEMLGIGNKLRYFGDGFEKDGEVDGRSVRIIPIMSGEFVIENQFGITDGVAGGNFFILGGEQDSALEAAEKAVDAIRNVEGTITPFPGGIVSSGSKVGSINYSFLHATTNHPYCPTIRDEVEETKLPGDVDAVYEIVINGLDLDKVKKAMERGIKAAVKVPEVVKISAGNYDGELGKYLISLEELVD